MSDSEFGQELKAGDLSILMVIRHGAEMNSSSLMMSLFLRTRRLHSVPGVGLRYNKILWILSGSAIL